MLCQPPAVETRPSLLQADPKKGRQCRPCGLVGEQGRLQERWCQGWSDRCNMCLMTSSFGSKPDNSLAAVAICQLAERTAYLLLLD